MKSSNSAKVNIKTTVVLPKYSNFTYNSKYSVKFRDKKLNPLKNTYVTIVFGGKTYKLKTDANGIVKITNHLKPGTYTVKVKNPKTSEVKTHKIKVLARIDKNKNMTMYYGAGKYYKFKVLDALITNFHLPESTLVMLVSALAGREHVLSAYAKAVEEKYRFFSFGDAMFIADVSNK